MTTREDNCKCTCCKYHGEEDELGGSSTCGKCGLSVCLACTGHCHKDPPVAIILSN